MTAHLIVLVFTLWLLRRVNKRRREAERYAAAMERRRRGW